MGLTIHYELHAPDIETLADAKKRVAQLHKFARTLPVKECSKVLQWKAGKDEPRLAALFAWCLPLGDPNADDCGYHFVEPLEMAMFELTQPGSEPAWFGLARYPLAFSDREKGICNRRTGLAGWRWNKFCKTQYASMPKEGGWDNFLAIHDGICRTLDEAARLKMKIKVIDEGKYWEDRDAEKLRTTIDRWNHMIAAFVGGVKDKLGGQSVVAPITQNPSFEQMEARGQKYFRRPDDDPDLN